MPAKEGDTELLPFSPPHFPHISFNLKVKKMMRIAVLLCCSLGLMTNCVQGQENPAGKDTFYALSPVEVRAVRAPDRAPVTKTNLSKDEIEKTNLGQDLPFLLSQTPSAVVNSDAGTGF